MGWGVGGVFVVYVTLCQYQYRHQHQYEAPLYKRHMGLLVETETGSPAQPANHSVLSRHQCIVTFRTCREALRFAAEPCPS
jgi:hypothetical protein